MKYSVSIRVLENNEDKRIKAFANIIFGGAFKINNVAIVTGKEGELFVSMPRYKSGTDAETGNPIYRDIANPITKEFREELYSNILKSYEEMVIGGGDITKFYGDGIENEVKVTTRPYEREGSNVKGFAAIYFDDKFIVNNISILESKGGEFVSMPSYKTSKVDEQGKAVYQDICYPVTKEFREKLNGMILDELKRTREVPSNDVGEFLKIDSDDFIARLGGEVKADDIDKDEPAKEEKKESQAKKGKRK